jgi:hypothetical protein
MQAEYWRRSAAPDMVGGGRNQDGDERIDM